MITNATITSIERPSGASAAGKILFAAAVSMSVPCAMTSVSGKRRLELGATLTDVMAQVRVLLADWPAGQATIAAGDRVVAAMDGFDAKTYESVVADQAVKSGGLSNFKAVLKVVR